MGDATNELSHKDGMAHDGARKGASTKLRILGIGNPLLDINAHVPMSLINKYKLELNNMFLCSEEQYPIYEEIQKDYSCTYSPGGATMNSIRVAQALLQKEYELGFSGSIGDDKEGGVFENLASSSGIYTNYSISQKPTGVCAVLIQDGDKSLCTNLSAAVDFKLSHLEGPLSADIKRAEIVYSAGYFLTVCVEGMRLCGKMCAEQNSAYAINLSAVFIVQNFLEQLESVFPYADYIFGNEAEFREYLKVKGIDHQNLEASATYILSLPKVNALRTRTVVITQGSAATLVFTGKPGEKLSKHEFPVEKIPVEEIVDVNGAGDAFVGGYLAALSMEKSLEECVKIGTYAASNVLRHDSCSFDFAGFKF